VEFTAGPLFKTRRTVSPGRLGGARPGVDGYSQLSAHLAALGLVGAFSSRLTPLGKVLYSIAIAFSWVCQAQMLAIKPVLGTTVRIAQDQTPQMVLQWASRCLWSRHVQGV
jgi:hypothetical protein